VRGLHYKILGLLHVMNLTISDDQQNVVQTWSVMCAHDVYHLINDTSEISRPTQRDISDSLSIQLKHPLGALDLRVGGISIQWETVRDLIHAHVVRDATETINWEASIIVIEFKN
jgi:hypothetical protein